jgi:hypothetical protein
MDGPSSAAGLMKVTPGRLRITHLNRVSDDAGLRLIVGVDGQTEIHRPAMRFLVM